MIWSSKNTIFKKKISWKTSQTNVLISFLSISFRSRPHKTLQRNVAPNNKVNGSSRSNILVNGSIPIGRRPMITHIKDESNIIRLFVLYYKQQCNNSRLKISSHISMISSRSLEINPLSTGRPSLKTAHNSSKHSKNSPKTLPSLDKFNRKNSYIPWKASNQQISQISSKQSKAKNSQSKPSKPSTIVSN